MVKPTDGCRVVGIIDGDTVRLLCSRSGVISGRVLGYDTPEKKARCLSEFIDALRATQHLRWMLWKSSKISTQTVGKDRYGRVLTKLSVDGSDVSERMIGTGLARRYDGGQRQSWCVEGFGGF
ncbi:thermonuclease family protein [Thalassovita aquimarina]|uniref:thermonuclease family protein n=1 Tax=Thalassovita aquimarina TaxID=2785917 RepID=UPI0035632BD5